MKAEAKTFKRYELKYFVTPEKYEVLIKELLKYMKPDDFCENGGSYMIYNLYFDTPDDEVIRHSLSKPFYKEKLRLRSYRLPKSESDSVFLELKKKVGGIVVKRRAVLDYGAALRMEKNFKISGVGTYEDCQVLEEIEDFLERYQAKPKVYISYERVAFYGKADREFRISFDRNILTRRNNVDLMSGDYGAALLPEGEYLMEVKCAGALPLWFSRLLSSHRLYVTGFSKYGTEFKRQIS